MKKREYLIIIVILSLIINLINLISAAAAPPPGIPISNCQGLQDMKNNLLGNYYLTQDIDCQGFAFKPVGYGGFAGVTFKGTFDGKDHRIFNLNVIGDTDMVKGGAAGLFGQVLLATIKDVGLENANIQGNGAIGGLVGSCQATTISGSYSKGIVKGLNGHYWDIMGGLIGMVRGCGVSNSYSNAEVMNDALRGTISGGFIGDSEDSYNPYAQHTYVFNCYSTGRVTGGAHQNGGFLGGYMKGTYEKCYFDGDTAGTYTSAAGSGRNTAQMKQKANFVNWDFDLPAPIIWKINENLDYPRLWFESGGGGCVPNCAGRVCGSDSCVGNCPPGCSGGQVCNSGVCCTPEPTSTTCAGKICGTSTNNCGQSVSCGTCNIPTPYCLLGTQCVQCLDINQCNDGKECTTDNCLGNSCVHTNNPDGSGCISGHCVSGNCVECTNNNECNDNIACTNDLCNAVGVCEHNPDNTKCNDNHDCTDNLCIIGIGCQNTVIPGCISRVGAAFWTNMTDIVIATADLNDRVKLIATGQNFLGQEIKYDIYKNGFWFFDQRVTSQTSNKEFITWRPSETATYYFIASVAGTSHQSDNLIVSNLEDNSPPVAIIDFPKGASIYSLTTNIGFNQTSYDPDDFMDYKWDFGDTNFITGSTRDYINYNTTHTYPNTGQKNINLSVLDERGKSDYDLTSILIIDLNIPPGTSQAYVFANISNPEIGENVANPVTMNAEGSYAIEVTSNAPADPTITCLAGACPCEVITPTGNIVIPGCPRVPNYAPLTFKWKFDNGAEGEVTINSAATYSKSFGSLGWHNAELTVNITPTVKSSVNTRFRVYGPSCPIPPCSLVDYCENGIWFDFDPNNPLSPPAEFDTTLTTSNNYCRGPDNNAAAIADNCCRSGGYTCKEDGHAGVFNCQLDPVVVNYCGAIQTCSDYPDSDHCNADSIYCNVAVQAECSRDVPEICPGVSGVRPESGCICKWETDSFGVESCKTKSEFDLTTSDGFSISRIPCSVTSTAGECLDDSMQVEETGIIDWTGVAIPPEICGAAGCGGLTPTEWLENNCDLNALCFTGTRNVLCGQDTVKLKFFTWLNLIIAIIIITIIYISIFAIKKRNR